MLFLLELVWWQRHQDAILRAWLRDIAYRRAQRELREQVKARAAR